MYNFQSEPQFIFPEGASSQRGRFELAFSQIGGSVFVGNYFQTISQLIFKHVYFAIWENIYFTGIFKVTYCLCHWSLVIYEIVDTPNMPNGSENTVKIGYKNLTLSIFFFNHFLSYLFL